MYARVDNNVHYKILRVMSTEAYYGLHFGIIHTASGKYHILFIIINIQRPTTTTI